MGKKLNDRWGIKIINKEELYKKAIKEIRERLETTKGIIPRMATVAAVLKNTIPYYFWCGFYFAEEDELVIGPYQGTTACANIGYQGVCGTSVKKEEPVIVKDVHKFPGHIVCDPRSKSEMAIPVRDNENRIIGVFDVDASVENAFDHTDKKYIEEILPILFEEE